MPEIREVILPGVGVRHEFETSSGQRVAVVSHRSGRRELLLYDDAADPDRCSSTLQLDSAETRALAELLGAARVSEVMAELRQNVAGLAIDWLTIPNSSPAAGHTIGDGQFRTRTGVSVVAIVRGETTLAAPGPETRLEADDVVVAVGTAEGLAELRTLLQP